MTVGLCVVLLEMTNMTATLPFLMLVVIVAKGTADRWNDSIIVRRIALKRLPFLARMPHLSYRRQTVTAADVAVTSGHPVLPPCAALPHLISTCGQDLIPHVDVVFSLVKARRSDAAGGLQLCDRRVSVCNGNEGIGMGLCSLLAMPWVRTATGSIAQRRHQA